MFKISKEIKFDILNYIDLRGSEIKEFYLTIINTSKISEIELINNYVLNPNEIPGYIKNGLKLLKQLKIITEKNKKLESSAEYPNLSFELNFFHHLSKLEEEYRIPHDIHRELVHHDINYIRQKDFQPWCIEVFKDRYQMTKPSANFWISLMSNFGLIQKLKFGNQNYIYNFPNAKHYNDLLNHFFENNVNNKKILIRDFAEFISENFFEVFVNENKLSESFQNWVLYSKSKELTDISKLSDATQFKIKKQSLTHLLFLKSGG